MDSANWKVILGEEFDSKLDRYVLFLLGTTASGKSQLGLKLAESNDLEIVNCDSVQIYKELNIGSAKPSPNEMSQVTHHLYDCVEPPKKITAGDYRRMVMELLTKTEKNLIFVGGSGFYFQALEKGMFELGKTDPDFREELTARAESHGLTSLFDELERRDPEYASSISSNDQYRIFRALEVMHLEGRPYTQIREEFTAEKFPFPILKMAIDMDRSVLRERVTQRCVQMIEQGIVEETRRLRERGFADWPPLQSVGYKQAGLFLDDLISHDQFLELMVTATMQLAKRQRTWFKRDQEICWLSTDLETSCYEQAQAELRRFTQSSMVGVINAT